MEWALLVLFLLVLAAVFGLERCAARRAIEATERERLEHQALSAAKRLSTRLEALSSGLESLRNEHPKLLHLGRRWSSRAATA